MSELHSDSDRLPAALERGPLVLHAGPGVDLTREQFFRLCTLNRDLRMERSAEGDMALAVRASSLPTGRPGGGEASAVLVSYENSAPLQTALPSPMELPHLHFTVLPAPLKLQ